ncbi:MAG: hypothetical protein LBS96_04975 [Oscillospiraceae bacterium]|jgi:uncharacterized membrane protein YcgQ (UPF0703/DUF1980 family)|nr:hypothetical protein [Oscillospiraceae bacterium]
MKKIAYLLVLVMAATALLAGCGKNEPVTETIGGVPAAAAPNVGGVVEIKEKMFLTQMNEIWLNMEEYLGKTIKLEGIYREEVWEEGKVYHSVLRNSPGCCGADGVAGFDVEWPEGTDGAYPAQDAWVAVAGVLERYEENGNTYVRLLLTSLEVKEERGAEFVSQ